MSRGRNWCLTINNCDEFIPFNDTQFGYLVQGRETAPTTGTRHLQVYVQFKDRKRLAQVIEAFPGSHAELARGSPSQNREYCIKDGDFCEDGEPLKQGQRSDLSDVKRIIDDNIAAGRGYGHTIGQLREEHFAAYIRYERSISRDIQRQIPNRTWETVGFIHWGATGTGKTRYCQETYPDAFWLSGTKWFDGYEGQEVVIVDEFYGWLPFSMLQRMLDRTPYNVETKGGTRKFLAKEVHFTSNKPLDEWYPGIHPNVKASLERRFEGRIKHYEQIN